VNAREKTNSLALVRKEKKMQNNSINLDEVYTDIASQVNALKASIGEKVNELSRKDKRKMPLMAEKRLPYVKDIHKSAVKYPDVVPNCLMKADYYNVYLEAMKLEEIRDNIIETLALFDSLSCEKRSHAFKNANRLYKVYQDAAANNDRRFTAIVERLKKKYFTRPLKTVESQTSDEIPESN
jgi:hypothetical protein